MRVCSFIIVLFLLGSVACSPLKEAGYISPKIKVVSRPVFVFENSITVPATTSETSQPWPEDLENPFQIEMENAWVEIQKLRSEKDSILRLKVECKERTIVQLDTLLPFVFWEEDSLNLYVYQVIGEDTNQIATIEKPKAQTLALPKDGRFPFELIILAVAALIAWALKRRKSITES